MVAQKVSNIQNDLRKRMKESDYQLHRAAIGQKRFLHKLDMVSMDDNADLYYVHRMLIPYLSSVFYGLTVHGG